MSETFFRSPAWIPIRIGLGLLAAFVGRYLWMRPRGFSFGSRAFFEHQVLVPALLGVLLAALLASWRQPRVATLGLSFLCAAGMGLFLAVTFVSNTPGGMAALVLFGGAGAGYLLLLLAGKRRGLGWGGAVAGGIAGALFAAAFLFCAWAPPATTRPVEGDLPAPHPQGVGPAVLAGSGFRVSVDGRLVVVERPPSVLYLHPGFEAGAAARSGFWTMVDFRSVELPPWTVRVEQAEAPLRLGRSLLLESSCPEVHARVRVWIERDEVRLRAVNHVRKELATHLSTILQAWTSGEPRVNGTIWPESADPAAFLAFRGDRLELLQGAKDEKGPFRTLGGWDPDDPVIEAGAFRWRASGWAAQASRAESPTAGWGVSQGAIERWRGAFFWSLAATSVGRGSHTVRTAPGTYVLDVAVAVTK